MDRVTMKMLESWVRMINRAAGTPLTYGTKTAEGLKPNGGHYFIEKAPTGYRFTQLARDGSFGEMAPLGYSVYTKAALYHLLRAYWQGLIDGQELAEKGADSKCQAWAEKHFSEATNEK